MRCGATSAREFTYTQTYSRMVGARASGCTARSFICHRDDRYSAGLFQVKRAFVRDALSKTVPAECSAALPCTNYFCGAAIADAREPLIIPTRNRAKSYSRFFFLFFFFFFFLLTTLQPILRSTYDNFASCWNV